MSARFEIVRTDDEQPYHVRVVGGNGEIVLAGENLTSFENARTAVLAVAGMFLPGVDLRGDPFAVDDGRWFISVGGQPTGARVFYRDERANPEPCS